ncbi:TPA: FHA domain-containing protein [Candidatus Poribacteria bacterium]|nr:FHA domain-containing protein [Candidatus Poribacteria bacterium]HIO06269.1 FHA domain-containing protein [Candidatus Poribacteria bacterium]
MKFWPPSALDPENETDQAEMLEAYTQWLNGEKLSDKQKKYLRVFQGSGDLEPLKELVDYVHYNFEEHEESEVFEPPANVKQRVEQKLMNRISQQHRGSQIGKFFRDVGIGFIPEPALGSPIDQQVGNPDSVLEIDKIVSLDSEQTNKDTENNLEIPNSFTLNLRVIEGENVGSNYGINLQPITIGSAPNATIRLSKESNVSSFHALLTIHREQLFIVNLDQEDGTYLDGNQIMEPTLLNLGSVIQIGNSEFEVIELTCAQSMIGISFKNLKGKNERGIFTVRIPNVVIGRNEKTAHIRFPAASRKLSREHARFDLKNNQIYITDLNSTNGTFVNGIRAMEPMLLKEGDLIKLGDTTLKITDTKIVPITEIETI